jgi:hypothetical protein
MVVLFGEDHAGAPPPALVLLYAWAFEEIAGGRRWGGGKRKVVGHEDEQGSRRGEAIRA